MTKVNYVTPACSVCQQRSTIENLDVNRVQRWIAGELIQDVFPELSNDERELMISGTHSGCWDAMFEDADDYGND